MKVLGIISEYNPFHNGHQYQIDRSKKELSATHTIAVMSGNFVMRGELAIFNKLTRAKAAVQGGVDLVLELPVPYALSSAEFFSKGAVSLLNSLNIVDVLSFGSECGDLESLKNIAKELIKEETQDKIKENAKSGLPIFKAIEQSIDKKYSEILNKPNNILGIHYLKALYSLNSNILPYTIGRHKVDYFSLETKEQFASATGIREFMKSKEDYKAFVPLGSYKIYQKEQPVFENSINQALVYSLRVKEKESFLEYPDVSEGLHNLIKEAANQFYDIEEIIQHIKSKRYSYTRIRRILYNIFLDMNKEYRMKPPEYARVLAFNEKGQELLSQLRKKSDIPLITNVTQKMFREYEMLQLDYRAAQIYQLACETKVTKGGLLSERL